MNKVLNFINGEYCESQNGMWLDNYDPSTGEVQSQICDSDEMDAVLAIQSANKAFPAWSKTPVAERNQILFRIADLLEQNLEKFAKAESQDVGKPYWLARDVDIPRAILNFRFFASRMMHHQEMSVDCDGTGLFYSLRQPLGVTGLIAPWNLPLYLLTWKIAPAIAVGNTAVCKPSELTSSTASMLGEIFNEAGLPPGVVNIVTGRGETAGAALVAHPGVPLISFTGGTITGEKIQVQAAPHCKKVGLELGGKNANIIFKDADLKKAIPMSLRSSFLNQGEICLSGSRIYVQQDIYDEFLDGFVSQVKQLKVGDPMDPDVFMGPVISKDHFGKINSCIEQGLSENGKLLAGDEELSLPDKNKNGYFLRPTVIADLTNCSDLWQREIFGPVVTVNKYKYAHDAVKLANTSPFGLSASIWTKDISRAHKTAAQIQAGTVWINTWMKRDLRVPFGGMKASGLGREGGEHSIDFYTEQKTIGIEY